MTKKRKSTKRSTTRRRKSSKGKSSLSLRSILVLLLLVGAMYLGERAGLIDVNWEAVLEGDFERALNDGQAVAGQQGAGDFAPSQPVAVEPVTGEWYQLYFTSPQYPDEVGTRVNSTAQGLIGVINSAQRSLDIAIYELDLPEVGDALLAARDRGVAVRIVTDSDELEELETLIRLEEAGIPIVPDERSPIMHNKFMVVDGEAVWTGSWNFTPNGTYRNNNNAIFIRSPQLAQNYAAEFSEMFNDHAFGPTSPANTPYPQLQIGDTLVETCFAPEDECAEKLVATLNQAQTSIRFMAFSFTHDGLGAAIRDRANAGVQVQGVFETRGSETEYSELGQMKQHNLDVWQDGNPYTLHHKVFIIDDKAVVLGSYNFSDNADESNDENLLVIHNPEIAGQYLAEFQRVYQQAQNPPN